MTLGIVLALALGGGALALRLQPNTSSDTFVNRSSPTYQASLDDNTALRRRSGGDPDPRAADGSGRDQGPRDGQPARGVPRRPGAGGQPAAPGVHAGAGRIRDAVRRVGEPVRQADEGPAGAGRVRAGNVPEPRGRGRQHRDRADRGAALSRRSRPPRRAPTSWRWRGTCRARQATTLENAAGQIAQRAGDHEPAPDVPELGHLRPAARSTIRSSSRRSCSTRRAG